MDLLKETEIILRDAGFETWPWSGGAAPVVYFENDSVLGCVYLFNSVRELLDNWQKLQDSALARFMPELRNAGEKAWNVYSIFLTQDQSDNTTQEFIEQIEENFLQTRKIARDGIISPDGLINTLLPLLPIRNRPVIEESNYELRIQTSLQDINQDGARAFLKGASPIDIVQILAEKQ